MLKWIKPEAISSTENNKSNKKGGKIITNVYIRFQRVKSSLSTKIDRKRDCRTQPWLNN